MLNQEFVKILACPETKQPLQCADAPAVERINERIAAGLVVNRDGQTVTEKIDDALVRNDGRFFYPVRQDIPVLLIAEAIAWENGAGQS